ncbi:hypothetical protein [Calidifontibacillus erzurumensis]|uniref:hypothetical protein n=1 Tax=Calidifontibacillus erzurumensis TaxID=2741433 RepID=UPI0035B5191A
MEKGEGINKEIDAFAIAVVCLLYGVLMVLVGYLMNGQELAFWLFVIGTFVLAEVLKLISVNINKPSVQYISIFTVEICTIIIFTVFSLWIVDLLIPVLSISSKSTFVMFVFCLVLILYELSTILKIHKKYMKFKSEFESSHNMVNLLTIPATLLTVYLLALGLDKGTDEIITDNFMYLCIIYVLLIHYCKENRLNN